MSEKYGNALIFSILDYILNVERACDSYKCEVAINLCCYNPIVSLRIMQVM